MKVLREEGTERLFCVLRFSLGQGRYLLWLALEKREILASMAYFEGWDGIQKDQRRWRILHLNF